MIHPKNYTTRTHLEPRSHPFALSPCNSSNQLIRRFGFLSWLIRLAETWKIENVSCEHITIDEAETWALTIHKHTTERRKRDRHNTILWLCTNEITRLGEQFHLLANRFSIAFQFSGEIWRPQLRFSRSNSYARRCLYRGFRTDWQTIITHPQSLCWHSIKLLYTEQVQYG